MTDRITDEQLDEPVTLFEEIEIVLAVGGLSPAQEAIVRKAAARIEELKAKLEIQKANASNARLDKELALQDNAELEAKLERVRRIAEGSKCTAIKPTPTERWLDNLAGRILAAMEDE